MERFESAYVLFFINSDWDGKLLGKNVVWQMIVFSRFNKVNFCLHIAGSKPCAGYLGHPLGCEG